MILRMPRGRRAIERGRGAVALGVALLATAVVTARESPGCAVPVFRYALERWESDPYRLTVFHDAAWSADDDARAAALVEQVTAGANLELRRVDVTGELGDVDAARWAARGDRSVPMVVVQPPLRASSRTGVDALSVPAAWDAAELARLVDSPARAELARRLAGGEVVWVLLESGDRDRDEAARAVLDRELAVLEATLELPQPDEADAADLGIDPDDLTIRFTSLAVSRHDPAERWLVEMLLAVESDLGDEDLAGEPMVFPVFGRGRALYALIGRGINAQMIRKAAEFLTGACQCTIKADNPGVDLLVRFPWHEHVTITPVKDEPIELTGLAAVSRPVGPPAEASRPDASPSAVSPSAVSPSAVSPSAVSPSAVSPSAVSPSAAMSAAAAPSPPAAVRSMNEPAVDPAADGPGLAVLVPAAVLLALGLVVALAAAWRSRPAA